MQIFSSIFLFTTGLLIILNVFYLKCATEIIGNIVFGLCFIVSSFNLKAGTFFKKSSHNTDDRPPISKQ